MSERRKFFILLLLLIASLGLLYYVTQATSNTIIPFVR